MEATVQPKSNFNFKQIFGKPIDAIDDILADKEKHIRIFEIPKKDGTKRKIIAPDFKLKYIQKAVYYKILKKYKADNASHGFVNKRGIVTNAIQHVGSNSVGKIDIEKFFDTISEKHLKNCLFGNRNICRLCKNYTMMLEGRCNPSLYANKTENYPHKCEEIKSIFMEGYCEKTGYQSLFKRLIDICTYKGFAAQGFPTSPMVANIVMRGFDKAMTKHCEEQGVIYTRYADDLSFSSKTLSSKDLKEKTKLKAYRLLWAFGFKPKRQKTKYRSKTGRMTICGIVVNVKTSIKKYTIKLFRAKVHHATVKFPEQTTRGKLKALKGWASFLMAVDKEKGKYYMEKLITFERQKFGDQSPIPIESNTESLIDGVVNIDEGHA